MCVLMCEDFRVWGFLKTHYKSSKDDIKHTEEPDVRSHVATILLLTKCSED